MLSFLTVEEFLFNAKTPYLTTSYLMSTLGGYRSPRDKIKNLVKSRDLIYVKNGLYLIGPKYQMQYSTEALPSIIYGPSAISFQYALSLHGIIPEKVETVTCISFKRDKNFPTGVGKFTYKYIAKDLFPIGLQHRKTDLGNYLLASPEKAVCDLAYFEKIMNGREAFKWLTDDLRMDVERLASFDPALLIELAQTYRRSSVVHVAHEIISMKKQGGGI